jgi:hypothetical protein
VSNSSLLAALLVLLVVEPFLSEATTRRWAFDLMLSGVVVAAVWTVGSSRRLFVVGLLLVVPALVAKWLDRLWPGSSLLDALWMLFALALFAFTVIVVLRQVLGSAIVSRDTMAGAVAAYLLLGVIWAITFALIELVHPGSFQIDGQPLVESVLADGTQVAKFLYLSLVTLTTVGYGDVLPVTAVARRMAVLEAIVGQLYLAVLVARLVSQHVSSPDRR